MRNVVLTSLLFISLVLGVSAEPTMHNPDDLRSNASLLAIQCGYVLNKSILSEVTKSSSKIDGQVISFDFYVSMKSVNTPIYGKLSFGCFTAGSPVKKQGRTRRLTAADEIAQADSGGRYARNVIWQRKYKGKGWSGTIAYVNSVFGDHEILKTRDYFLICPDKGDLACFSFEIENARLNEREGLKIPELIEGIGVDESRSGGLPVSRLEHGGEVTSGSPWMNFMGRPLARKGDDAICAVHGPATIDESYAKFPDRDGKQVAFHHFRCACGCRLISSLQNVNIA